MLIRLQIQRLLMLLQMQLGQQQATRLGALYQMPVEMETEQLQQILQLIIQQEQELQIL